MMEPAKPITADITSKALEVDPAGLGHPTIHTEQTQGDADDGDYRQVGNNNRKIRFISTISLR